MVGLLSTWLKCAMVAWPTWDTCRQASTVAVCSGGCYWLNRLIALESEEWFLSIVASLSLCKLFSGCKFSTVSAGGNIKYLMLTSPVSPISLLLLSPSVSSVSSQGRSSQRASLLDRSSSHTRSILQLWRLFSFLHRWGVHSFP